MGTHTHTFSEGAVALCGANAPRLRETNRIYELAQLYMINEQIFRGNVLRYYSFFGHWQVKRIVLNTWFTVEISNGHVCPHMIADKIREMNVSFPHTHILFDARGVQSEERTKRRNERTLRADMPTSEAKQSRNVGGHLFELKYYLVCFL